MLAQCSDKLQPARELVGRIMGLARPERRPLRWEGTLCGMVAMSISARNEGHHPMMPSNKGDDSSRGAAQ